MTLKELRDWADRLIADQEYRHFGDFKVIFNPMKFGDRHLQTDDLGLEPPRKENADE